MVPSVFDRGGIRSIRASQYSEEIVRVVFELASNVEYRALDVEAGLLIEFDNAFGTFPSWSSGSAEKASRRIQYSEGQLLR